MSEEIKKETGSDNGETVVRVPADKAQAVLDFIAGLEADEGDVSGYMLSRGLAGGVSLSAARLGDGPSGGPSGTGCYTTLGGSDFYCVDTMP